MVQSIEQPNPLMLIQKRKNLATVLVVSRFFVNFSFIYKQRRSANLKEIVDI